MALFLNPEKPIHTCERGNCIDCDVREAVNCHFDLGQLLRFLGAAAVPAAIGGVGIYRFSPWLLLVWAACFLGYFGLVEIRVMCSHCPHYAEPELRSLKCWANYGSPKLWKYRPGPMSFPEKAVFFAGLAIVILMPVPLMLLSGDFLLLVFFLGATAVDFWALIHFLCTRCMNFACPLNRVDQRTRGLFLNHNPVVRSGWQQ